MRRPSVSASEHAGDRRRGRVPEPDHAVPVDEDDAVADGLERARRPAPPLHLGVQPRVVDRRGGVPRQLLREGGVLFSVHPAGLGRDERDRADHLAAGGERHGHVGLRRERARDFELVVVEAEGCERALVDLRHEHGLGPARRDRDRREHRLLQLAGERELERVGVLEREPLEPSVEEDVDRAPVGDPRHGKPRDVGERLLVVERAPEHPAGLGEERLPLLGELAVLDIGRRADPAVVGRQRAAQEPAVRAVGEADPVLGVQRCSSTARFVPGFAGRGRIVRVDEVLPGDRSRPARSPVSSYQRSFR